MPRSTAAQPLRGTGIVIVLGSCTIQSGSNSWFSGLLWVQGALTVRAPCYLRGTLIAGGTVDVRGTGGDTAEVEHDAQILNNLLFLMGQYRHSKAVSRAQGTTPARSRREGLSVSNRNRAKPGFEPHRSPSFRPLVVLAAMAGVALLTRSAQHARDWSHDRVFARQKALSILAELRAYVEGGEGEVAADLDGFDDGLSQNAALTITPDPNDPGAFVAPDHPLSANNFESGDWRWYRRITVRRFPGVDTRDLRICTVPGLFRMRPGRRVPRRGHGGGVSPSCARSATPTPPPRSTTSTCWPWRTCPAGGCTWTPSSRSSRPPSPTSSRATRASSSPSTGSPRPASAATTSTRPTRTRRGTATRTRPGPTPVEAGNPARCRRGAARIPARERRIPSHRRHAPLHHGRRCRAIRVERGLPAGAAVGPLGDVGGLRAGRQRGRGDNDGQQPNARNTRTDDRSHVASPSCAPSPGRKIQQTVMAGSNPG